MIEARARDFRCDWAGGDHSYGSTVAPSLCLIGGSQALILPWMLPWMIDLQVGCEAQEGLREGHPGDMCILWGRYKV